MSDRVKVETELHQLHIALGGNGPALAFVVRSRSSCEVIELAIESPATADERDQSGGAEVAALIRVLGTGVSANEAFASARFRCAQRIENAAQTMKSNRRAVSSQNVAAAQERLARQLERSAEKVRKKVDRINETEPKRAR